MDWIGALDKSLLQYRRDVVFAVVITVFDNECLTPCCWLHGVWWVTDPLADELI